MLQELAPCACGTRCGGRCGGSSAFSLLSFPAAGGREHHQLGYYGEEGASSPYGVDCTLSLGTPSTRRAEARVVTAARAIGAASSCKEPGGLPARRRCANCDTTSTPLWRNGPQGPKSLCNACGIRYKKEERRAAAATTTQDAGLVGSYSCGAYARQQQHQQQQHPPPQWGCYGSSAAAYGYGDNNSAVAADGNCLSWMLNVMPSSPAFAGVRERHSTLFQYY
ncbi:hypothetical protein PR202_gb02150 [Eleusine coracana subsp. coracana]|uniref:GATA-type domain-containing protein n=1 Tax=Eleusine coracana subsp. coracana TaxID=191504 RepID=A0AAV5DW14_ELECO|nr:hypothetical protein PR202_gb02150 [Eleusine coracana subsp. coracana]